MAFRIGKYRMILKDKTKQNKVKQNNNRIKSVGHCRILLNVVAMEKIVFL